jgi:hypothetical protein
MLIYDSFKEPLPDILEDVNYYQTTVGASTSRRKIPALCMADNIPKLIEFAKKVGQKNKAFEKSSAYCREPCFRYQASTLYLLPPVNLVLASP